MAEPAGVQADSDGPWECDGCNRLIKAGKPYWGGGLDYWGEAIEVRCERCEIEAFKAAEKMCADFEREEREHALIAQSKEHGQ